MVLANIIAVYHLFKGMRARDKVLCVAFGICAQATLGDHRVYRQLPTFAGAAGSRWVNSSAA
ncbi:ethanolamine utilization protein EutH [Serratia ureilytica]